MPEFTLNVFMQNSDYVKQLELERDEAIERATEYKLKYQAMSRKCNDEQYVNLELIDICKANGFKFRPGVDIRSWEK